ncbi:SEC-C motif-containing protein [Flavobacterium sp. CG_9.1]|uniref:YchJ family protein n=1 Tax=Flavobacterium sp. CG_9.1 TaxID=2787728 RepID=UPI0018CB95A9|nr:YchJ family metal-binding protein [Flavobacterium sp. CG_9.1]MBG6062017.1 SEC-C motif-containing protein [Flavobacterium sp. CG_9.1]
MLNSNQNTCFCGLGKSYQECCEPIINGIQKATTAELLMRSRYSAYVTHQADYLVATTHVSKRSSHSKSEILNWATRNKWLQLEIIYVTEYTVEFKAYFLDSKRQQQIHHELSSFKLENGNWFYVDGEFI